MRVWRWPAVHFAAIGAVLFAVDSLREPAAAAREAPPVSAAALDDEALLVREARRLGFHRTDPLVRRRLARNTRFLARDDASRSEEDLVEEALALGLDETDLVVRRRLAQKMRLRAHAAARAVEPTESEIADFVARHPERFERPALLRVSHVYLSRDRRGDSLERDALTLLEKLRASGTDPEAVDVGDPFLFSRDLPPRSQRELAEIFGENGAAEVSAVPLRAWHGPVGSPYGAHLVWVHERVPGGPPELASVRGAAREGLLAERGDAELSARIVELRE